MTWLRISAVDAWFFRDGRPYTQGETSQSDVTSLFPPSPLTISGALRAALARANGWDGKPKGWTPVHLDMLGRGPEETGKLSFRGPFLSREGSQLFPLPLHLLVREGRQFALVAPAASTACDLGHAVHLPQPRAADRQHIDWKRPAESFLTAQGLDRVLAGKLPQPDELIAASHLRILEARIGLKRDAYNHATGDEGDLYSPVYVRLAEKGHDVSLLVEVRGEPSGWQWPKLIPFGGESRMAALEPIPKPPAVPRYCNGSEVLLLCLTPLRLPLSGHTPIRPLPGRAFFASLGIDDLELVSACTDRPVMIGGWDSQAPGPLPLRPCLPAGTVLFCRASGDATTRLQKLVDIGLGADARLGFNQFTLGVWPSFPAT
jgi:CRISPR-associated protein Cmr3